MTLNECLFANKLREMNIPYLYEMSVGGGVLPDFTLFIEDKVYFVELFGKLNDKVYREKQKEKIKKYEKMILGYSRCKYDKIEARKRACFD